MILAHKVKRHNDGFEGPYYVINDGRFTTTMTSTEFFEFAKHIAAVAAGAEESHSPQWAEWMAELKAQRQISVSIDDLDLGLATAVPITRRKFG